MTGVAHCNQMCDHCDQDQQQGRERGRLLVVVDASGSWMERITTTGDQPYIDRQHTSKQTKAGDRCASLLCITPKPVLYPDCAAHPTSIVCRRLCSMTIACEAS